MHEGLKRHALRTMNPAEADLFVLPIDTWLSAKGAVCQGQSHDERMKAILKAIKANPWWARNSGHDHLVISNWWGTGRALGDALLHTLVSQVTMVTYDEYFGTDWGRLIVAPCKASWGEYVCAGCQRPSFCAPSLARS